MRRTTAGMFVTFCASFVEAQTPPFTGTAFLSTNIIATSDPSAFGSMSYAGIANRLVFDRRVNQFVEQEMHLFNVVFLDGLDSEIQVNLEFGDMTAAAVEAEKYGRVYGRLPTSLRDDVDSITIHKGLNAFGGGNRNILIHADQALQYGGYLEEILFHEASHTSFDADHAESPGWLAARQSDPTFISTYAQDNPTREDVAESLLTWFAIRYRSSALTTTQRNSINLAIPNRLAYFDALPFQLYQRPLPGDFNLDGIVTGTDLATWLTGFGKPVGAFPAEGDADFDGDVDGEDFLRWQRATTVGMQAGRAIPELSTKNLLALGFAAIAATMRLFRMTAQAVLWTR